MNTPRPMRRHMGIGFRIALLSWLVTLVTVGIFVSIILPELKQTFLEIVQSKARGISVSVRDVAVGALVTEDYGTVVDHCIGMLSGDQALEYLVLTRGDGFSLVHNRAGWFHTNSAPPQWRPANRQITSGIDSDFFPQRRAFHYSTPLDYSGIPWGWIHVGLSLDTYDRSMTLAYRRTGLLAVICIALSLAASVAYARRLVQPIKTLEAVLGKVAQGDLSVRASIRSADEVESLANSFNLMIEALLARDRTLQSVRFAAQHFLSHSAWKNVLPDVLQNIGQAFGGSRVYLFENHSSPHGHLAASQIHQWLVEPRLSPDLPRYPPFDWTHPGFSSWIDALKAGDIISESTAHLSPDQQHVLQQNGVQSLILVPIKAEGVWWGVLGLEDGSRTRLWNAAERDSLRAAAHMLGAIIERQKAQDALVEAKQTLELRVQQRTRQLVEQITAKEKAHADLAQTQQRLLEVSRLSGMAEVATGVLHNVGNVLNSINVSTTLVVERLRQSKMASLRKLSALLNEHTADLATFLTQTEKGRLVPGYLSTLGQALLEEQASCLNELESLRQNVDHIKEIIAMQQSYAKVSGVVETISAAELVEDAIRVNLSTLDRHGIGVSREFSPLPPLRVEKHKVLQILINLIRNATYALRESHRPDKRLVLRISPQPDDSVQIQLEDNGTGIAPENLTRIFAHGFTTRDDGHGFGLHSGALAARELGGSLVAESAGPGKGATFTLKLPREAPKKL